jgi:molybdenum cofactor cytidylyltransferase
MAFGLIEGLRLGLDPQSPDVVALVGGGGKSSLLFRLVEEAVAQGVRVVATTTTHLGEHQAAHAPGLVTLHGATLPQAEIARALDAHGQCLLVGPPVEGRVRGILPDKVDELVAQGGIGLIVVEADGSRRLPLKAPAAHEPTLPQSTTHLLPVAGVDAVGRLPVAGAVHRAEQVRGLLQTTPATHLTPAQVARLLIHPAGGARLRPIPARLIPIVNKVETPVALVLARLCAQLWPTQGLLGLLTQAGLDGAGPVRERWGPWAVVVAAAGGSRRMGRAKQLVEVDGELMVRRALKVALASRADQVVLVTGAYRPEVEAAVADLTAGAGGRLTLVYNAAWESGQASSIQTGLKAPATSCQAVAFMPVDQPFVPATLLDRLAAAWRHGARWAAPTVEGVLRGAPALFDRSLWPALMAVQGDVGGRVVLHAQPGGGVTLPVPAAWLRDVDSPDDLSWTV